MNRFSRRHLADVPGLLSNMGITKGLLEYSAKTASQTWDQLKARFYTLKNQPYTTNEMENVSFIFKRKKNLEVAAHLQQRYIDHLKLASERNWDVLLDIVSNKLIKEMEEATSMLTPDQMRTLYYFELLENYQPPKIVSYKSFPGLKDNYLQILVRFNMRVKCLGKVFLDDVKFETFTFHA